jgi:hypothetical protein
VHGRDIDRRGQVRGERILNRNGTRDGGSVSVSNRKLNSDSNSDNRNDEMRSDKIIVTVSGECLDGSDRIQRDGENRSHGKGKETESEETGGDHDGKSRR